MKEISNHWMKQMLGCQRKGREAFERGDSRDQCPYKVINPWGARGPRNLTRARTQYWLYGYDIAAGIKPTEPQ